MSCVCLYFIFMGLPQHVVSLHYFLWIAIISWLLFPRDSLVMFTNKCWDSIGQAYYNSKSGIVQPMICNDLHLPSTISQSMHCLQGEVQRGIPAWAFWKLFWGNRTHPYLHLLETRYIYLFLVALFNFLYPRWALPHCYKLQSISIEGKEVSVVHLSKNKLTYHFT